MKRIAIIDDEEDARFMLRSYLENLCPDVEIAGEADSVESGYRLIRQTKPNAILLDISMLDGSGFDLLDKFANPSFRVIFITAYDEFALRAFRYYALDYLLKPVAPNDLVRAIDRMDSEPDLVSKSISHLLDNARNRHIDKIAIASQEGMVYLRLTDIVRLDSDGNYTTFHLLNKENFVATNNLKEFEGILGNDEFFRIHQSHLVNLSFVKKFLKEDGGLALMEDGFKAPVARRRKDEFLELLKNRSR